MIRQYYHLQHFVSITMKLLNMVKVVVFDVDGTLLHRHTKKVNGIKHNATVNGRYIYYRPYLKQLGKFVDCSKEKFKAVLWSSMKRYNAQPIQQLLAQNFNIKFDRIFCQDSCGPDLSKDLKVVANFYETNVKNVVLIDDSMRKRIGDQNFIEIDNFDGRNNQDQQILRIIAKINQFLNLANQQAIFWRVPHQTAQKPKQQIYDKDGKIIVFDFNKTLVSKIKQKKQFTQVHFRAVGRYIELRPYIKVLQLFHKTHTQKHNIKFVIWTSMTGKKNAKKILQHMKSYNLPFENILEGSMIKEEQDAKDLRVVADIYGCNIDNIILVDDSAYKLKQNQNFIKIQSYIGQKDDKQLIRIVADLQKFIGCGDECDIKKLLDGKIDIERNLKSINIKQQQHIQTKGKKKNNYIAQKDDEATSEMMIKKQKINPNSIEKQEQYQLIDSVKFYPCQASLPIKCLVFDINETLLNRQIEPIQGIKIDKKFKHYFNYYRPNLECLSKFFENTPHIKKCLWTTIKLKNSQYMRQMLEEKNLHFDFMFTQEDLIDRQKDLELISTKLGLKTQQIILIDDNKQKRVNNQNFMHIRAFNVKQQNDKVLIELFNQLNKIIDL